MQSRFPRLVSDAADANGRTGVLRSKVLEDAERVANAAQVRAVTVLHHADRVTLAIVVGLTPVNVAEEERLVDADTVHDERRRFRREVLALARPGAVGL